MTRGHSFLMQEFGVRPRIGWHIDPFGHAAATPTMFADMGFDAFYFGRADHQDKDKREKEKTMNMVWRGSPSRGTDADMFTGLLNHGYNAPNGFCFDTVVCEDEPVVNDATLETYNVKERSDAFAK